MQHELKKVSVSKLSPFDFGKFFYEDARNEGKKDASAQFEALDKCRKQFPKEYDLERCKNGIMAIHEKREHPKRIEREEA